MKAGAVHPGAQALLNLRLYRLQRQLGIVHELRHLAGNHSVPFPLPGPAPIRPVSPRGLIQGRSRLVTPINNGCTVIEHIR